MSEKNRDDRILSRELEISLISAVRDAQKRRHEYVTLEHVFYAILFDPKTSKIIEECGGNVTIIASIEDPAVIQKILAHLDDNATSAATSLLPDCRASPTVCLFV